jgi:cellulose synthase/poly-beta-1,6-N-acetylglucosamine synthase-like glycosyltransferase
MSWRDLLTLGIIYFNYFVLYYFVALNSIYLVLFLASLGEVIRFVRRTFRSDYQQILTSDMTWPISILVPAHNEEKTIVATVRSLLMLNYGQFEIVVINDGSSDRTLRELVRAFELRRMDKVYKRSIPTQRVRGVYGSLVQTNLLLVDKERGGKSDALNCGINFSRYPLFCSVDADSVIEEDALLKVVKPFMEHPAEMVAVGGIVRCVNGCEVNEGRVTRVGLPRNSLAAFQVVEYLRAFLTGRLGWSALRSLLIISGAFGLYKKKEVIEVGGYDHYTDTEDLELVVQLHENLRRKKQPYRIVFVPDPVCWTEVPTTWKILFQQRNRWHRGMLQSFARHKRIFFNPRYGLIGGFAFPYFLLFETCGPFVEILGYLSVALSLFLGILNVQFFLLFFVLAVVYGVFLSVAAILLEEISFRRYPRWEDLARLLLYGIAENFGYRQLLALFKVKGFWDFLRRRRMWGTMEREGFRAPGAKPSPAGTGASGP